MPDMLEKIPDFLNEVLTGSSDPVTVALLSRLKRERRVVRLAARVDLFGTLLEKLGRESFPDIPDPNASDAAFVTFAFFESYFSNYIEGTEFELEEARRIVETGIAMPTRDADSHDVLGTYAVVSNRCEMSRRASTPDEFLDILRERHRIVLAGRPSAPLAQGRSRPSGRRPDPSTGIRPSSFWRRLRGNAKSSGGGQRLPGRRRCHPPVLNLNYAVGRRARMRAPF